ncbi:SEL1-like repeat protein [Helicobacter felis]|nr:SEL1-like repeat protein [Helicobacter felis]
MYTNGEGVGVDKEMAYEYFKKACKMGYESGCKNAKSLLGD